MDASLESTALAAFADTFEGTAAIVARAPGRVELLGNHTDYNGGYVLAAAINRFTVVAGRPTSRRQGRLSSLNLGETAEIDLDANHPGEPGTWARYARGVVWALTETFGPPKKGFDLVVSGNIPLGAGLSSSAGLQAALAMFLLGAEVFDKKILTDEDRMLLAKTLRRSENEFVGVASGLLDQFSVVFGRLDHALMLDCFTEEYERLSLGSPAPAIVVCDSKTSRRLADGMYNRRRDECRRIVSFFQARSGAESVRCLRDVSLADLEKNWDSLDPIGRLRARHVLTENARVLQGAEALRGGDLAELGRLMTLSHSSSRDDFANSSPALDALVSAAESAPGFLGGKLSGAGWAGCTVNLVEQSLVGDFSSALRAEYSRRIGDEPSVHICLAAEGATFAKFD